jgi:hypothetical protein
MVGVRTGPRVGTSRPHRELIHRPGSRPIQHRRRRARRRCRRIPDRCRATGRIAPLARRYPRHRGSVVRPDSRPTPRHNCPALLQCTRTLGQYKADCIPPRSDTYRVHRACRTCRSRSVQRHTETGCRSCSRSLRSCREERAHQRIARCHRKSWSNNSGRHRPLHSWGHTCPRSQHTRSGSRPPASGRRQGHRGHRWSGSR